MYFKLEKVIGKKNYYLCRYYCDNDEINNVLNFFKKINIYRDKKQYNSYNIPYSRIFELELWFQKFNYSYSFETGSEPIYPILKRETIFFRNNVYNDLITNRKLKQHQIDFLNWAVKRNRHLNSDEPGLGKTLQAICLFSYFYQKKYIDSIIILVKKNLTYQWKREILDSVFIFPEDRIGIITNENKIKIFEKNIDKNILIIQNHIWSDIVLSYKYDGYIKKKSKLKWNEPYCDILKLWNKKSCYLVIDESHEYKHESSLKSKSIESYLPYFNFRTLLTATPATNSFIDWVNQIRLIDKSIIPFKENEFRIYVSDVIGNKYSPYDIIKYNEEKVFQIKQSFSLNVIKRRKKDLPEIKTERIIKPVYFEMNKDHKKIYENIHKQEIQRLYFDKNSNSIKIKDIKHKFPYSLLCVDNPFLLQKNKDIFNIEIEKLISKLKIENDIKIQYIDDYVKEHVEIGNEKIIIFDHHPKTLNILHDKYIEYNPVMIHGELQDSDKERQNKIDIFNDKNSNCKIAILSIFIANAGYNLNKGGCNRIIYYSLPYDAEKFRQSLDRTDRVDSEKNSLIEILLYGETLDELRYKVIDARNEFNDEFLNSDLDEKKLYDLMKRGKL